MNLRSRSVVAAIATALAVIAAPHEAGAQSAEKIRRIGYLGTGTAATNFQKEFVQGLRDLGWVAGENIEITFRFADGKYERLPDLATELVRRDVELIVAQPTAAAVAASKATRTIPIVMINAGDPDRIGLVESLARPGGNVTGTAYSVGLETIAKGLEILKESIPGARRVAVLSNPGNPAQPIAVANLAHAAQPLRLELLTYEARGPDDFARVFADIGRQRADALFVVAEGLFVLHRTALADLALEHRLPTFHGIRENVAAGGLMSYGPSLAHTSRRAAIFADRILRGARPADLAVEQPTKFELVINLGTAKALGLTIPQPILLRADEVIR